MQFQRMFASHQPIMSKVQYRTFQNYPSSQISYSPLSNGNKYRRTATQSKVLKLKSEEDLYILRRLRAGSPYSNIRLNILGSFGSGIASSSSRYSSFAKKPFSVDAIQKSQPPRVFDKNKSDNVSVNDGKSDGKVSGFKGFKWWNWKRPRSLAASKDVDTVTSCENLVEDVEKSVKSKRSTNQDSKEKSKPKRPSKSKQNKELLSSAEAFSDPPNTEGSRKVSPAKASNVSSKSGLLEQASENISAEPTPKDEVATTSTKKPASSRRKQKPLKEANKAPVQEVKRTVKQQQLYPPTGKSVVVVESVTKAKVIQGYLGDKYEVIASYGHVRDLAARSGSVRPDDDFSMVWEVPSAAWTHLKGIKVALSGVENLILASDPDREGEAIAWHIVEMLQQQDALHKDINVARVVFHEITETSIKTALQSPRDIDANLVNAYLARRALDYLIGFNISPLLWRKLPGCQSAGRVQSAALSLISDREMEIDEFKPQEYWTVEVEFDKKEVGPTKNTFSFSSHLTHSESEKLNQFSIDSDVGAKDIEQKIHSSDFEVIGSKRNKSRKNPPTPYITSSLQQDAANKLHFTPTYTMKLAQKLYEGVQLPDDKATGLITYTRTDGLHVSNEAAKDIHSMVIERYGQDFASASARKYFKKVKNAQEAHEAIRPTDIRRVPSMLSRILDEDSLKLYTLIWSRTMACQMEPATIGLIQVDVGNAGQSIVFRSSCSRVEFLGYQAAYEDKEAEAISREDEGNDSDESFEALCSLKVGDALRVGEVELKQHYTQPPPRYSEGSLVKKLEELGIGRPSTYASTIKVLKDRTYIALKGRALHPEFRGRMVSAFLSHHFSEVSDYSFTADMETELDNVSAGITEWKGLLKDYWTRFSTYCDHVSNVHIHQVEKMLEKTFGDFLFASMPNNSRTCPSCMEGTLIFKVSRFGAGYFIGCDQHPKCKYIAKTLYGEDEDDEIGGQRQNDNPTEPPKVLGSHPSSNEKVLLKNGPYGYYVQLGEDRKGYLPKRASVAKIRDKDSITLEDALELLRFPLMVGNHPDDGQPVVVKLARMGFTVRHRRTIATVPKGVQPTDLTLDGALELLKSNKARQCGRPKNKPKPEIYEVM